MLKTLRKNNKKILAFVMIFLMIAFIVPSVAKRPSRNAQTDLIGQIGDEKIFYPERAAAAEEWHALTQQSILRGATDAEEPRIGLSFADQTLARKLFPIAENMISQQFGGMRMNQFIYQYISRYAGDLARQVTHQLDATTYLLLVKEAQRMGVQVNNDLVQTALANFPAPPNVDPQVRQTAIGHWLMVLDAFERIASAAKVSPAEAASMVAQREEKISIALVEFKADKYKEGIKPPTTQQAQEFYQKYRNENRDAGESIYGYRYPNRVRVQYVRVPREKVKATVTVEDAYRYYKRYPDRFQGLPPTSLPTSMPTTREALGPSTALATAPTTRPSTNPATQASTQPTTRPFAEVKDRIIDDLSRDYALGIAKSILQAFSADWPAFHQAARTAGTTHPADSPATTLGVPYNSYLYLIRLRDRIQASKDSRGVLPESTEEGTVLSEKELADLPGIGKAYETESRLPFARFAVGFVEPFMTTSERRQAVEGRRPTLALFQPSPILIDNDGNPYVFRVIEADPAHAPRTFDEVAPKVREDFVASEAFKKAREAATKFMELAKSKGGLQQALNANGDLTKLTVTEPFRPGEAISKDVKLPNDAIAAKFTIDAFELLHERLRTGKEHPIGLIESPKGGTIVAAQLEKAEPAPLEPGFAIIVSQQQNALERYRQAEMLTRWLNAEEIIARLKFVPDQRQQKKETSDPLGQPPPIL